MWVLCPVSRKISNIVIELREIRDEVGSSARRMQGLSRPWLSHRVIPGSRKPIAWPQGLACGKIISSASAAEFDAPEPRRSRGDALLRSTESIWAFLHRKPPRFGGANDPNCGMLSSYIGDV